MAYPTGVSTVVHASQPLVMPLHAGTSQLQVGGAESQVQLAAAVPNQGQISSRHIQAVLPEVPVSLLDLLGPIHHLQVSQKPELFPPFPRLKSLNKYGITNVQGYPLYFALENSSYCQRCCCGTLRHFEMSIMDHSNREVLHLHRPLKYSNHGQEARYRSDVQTIDVELSGFFLTA
ncbi:hypothetical protein RvY_02513 [Ramazzottius varieornatus]|uniref:Phospholipid scramblase n=1 Tax=Ramazzottius varieornatus TaxID=947166 RepID=A0A1D1UNQ7_RAMVA|nr:hypothetical protein RvY_02513 [Ramazzottius varieornatus]